MRLQDDTIRFDGAVASAANLPAANLPATDLKVRVTWPKVAATDGVRDVPAQAGILPEAIVGGISTARTNRAELAQLMVADVCLARSGSLPVPRLVIASNGSVIAKYHRDSDFRALIDRADIVDPDGQPLIFASKLLLREPLHERIATTDFINDAAAAAAEHGVRFYFLGARAGVAEAAAQRLAADFPGLQVVGAESGYFERSEIPGILARIRASRADVLWLGLGSPHQERFAVEHRAQLAGLGWIRTCGGLFDYIGGDVPRAPRWMQKIGLEWMFRAILEPRRLGVRYLVTNPAAVYHLLTKTRN
ncbi:WecB/TagA/CpsF family glycosyltransferase [Novosphingobium sp.]|uniref:WecB/TagA/CpsF family glycosyltransferase n=1 Tax=Novosphingobium sp. TaxID=1874826 RepID=UPI003D1502D1